MADVGPHGGAIYRAAKDRSSAPRTYQMIKECTMPKFNPYITTTACLMLATTAMAQSDAGQTNAAGEKTADNITCADIVSMDTAIVPGVLYFVAGYHEGNGSGASDSQADMSQTTSNTETGGAESSDPTMSDPGNSDIATYNPATSDTASSGSGSSGAADATGSASDTTEAGAASSGTSAAASSGDTATSSDTSQAASAENGADTSTSGDDKMRVMRVAGLYEIPVEDVLTVCNDSPDDKVGDVVKQHAKKDQASSD